MAGSYTTTKLLADIKRLGHFPTNEETFEDSDLLALADYEMQTFIVPMVKQARENYWLKHKDYQVSEDELLIPDRAIAGGLTDLQLIVGANIEHLRYLEVSQLNSTIGSPVGAFAFTVQYNKIIIVPSPTIGFIRAYYYCRPSNLVKTTDCARISSIDTLLNQVVVESLPSTMTTGIEIDFIQNTSGFSIMEMDQAITGVAGTTLTFSSLPEDLAEGDWIALAGESPIPQIPVEFQPLLTQAVVVKICEIQGYLDKMKVAQQKLDRMREDLLTLIDPRIAEAPKVINSQPNGPLTNNWYWPGWFRRY